MGRLASRPRFALAALCLLAALISRSAPALPDARALRWDIDARPVLARGGDGAIDRGVVGDPCIVWDDSVATWRMFYFASGVAPDSGARGPRTAMALAKSAEEIGPGDWRKLGLVAFTNPEALINRNDFHKWWVVMDALHPNYAARLEGRYWAVFAASKPLGDGRLHKHVQAAWATTLAGPWTAMPDPILAPGTGGDLDALHADTPSAFWFEDRHVVGIFYKGYPAAAQPEQPNAPFGSGTMLATWKPGEVRATKKRILLRPGNGESWNHGWTSSIQLLPPGADGQWYGLHNGSPTAPADLSHREPAPSLGGWVTCRGHPLDGEWAVDTAHSPFRRPEELTPAETTAGLAANFWRHHLLVTPRGRLRVFFNSGNYGREQMYSLVPHE